MMSLMVPFRTFSFLDFLADLLQKFKQSSILNRIYFAG
jgi:hypothetical protein